MDNTNSAEVGGLRAQWTTELAQDLQELHGIDIHDEIVDILKYEIRAEIDAETKRQKALDENTEGLD